MAIKLLKLADPLAVSTSHSTLLRPRHLGYLKQRSRPRADLLRVINRAAPATTIEGSANIAALDLRNF